MAVNLNLGDYNRYRPDFLIDVPENQLRQEYARLRGIYNKRVTAMERSEFTNNPRYQNIRGTAYEIPSALSGWSLAQATSDLARTLQYDLPGVSALKKQRAQNIRTLHEHGFTNVTRKNYDEFVAFMEQVRAFYGSRALDSDRVAEVFNIAQKKGIAPEELQQDLSFWVEHMREFKYAKTHNADGSERTAEDYRQAIQRKQK